MEQLLRDKDNSIFLSVGQMYYQLSKSQAVSRSHYIQWCLKLDPMPKCIQEVSLMAGHQIVLLRLDSKSISEVTLTKVAHYIQTGRVIGLNVFTVADVLKAAKALAIPGLVNICIDHLLQMLMGQGGPKLTTTSEKILTLLMDGDCPLQFPNRTYFLALSMGDWMMKAHGDFQWECTRHSEEKIHQEAHSAVSKVVDPLCMLRDFFPKRKNMFQDLFTNVAPENYVFDDSQILYMMELTSVHGQVEEVKDAKDADSYERMDYDEVGSPRTLEEEWRLSPAKSIDLDEEFAEIDREFLHHVYDDNYNL